MDAVTYASRSGAHDRAPSRIRTIARDVGLLQIMLGATMLGPSAVSAVYGEMHSALACLASAGISTGCGLAAYLRCRESAEPSRHEAMAIAGAGWLSAAVFGALPFLLAAHWTPEPAARALVPPGAPYASSLVYFRDPLHAFFESMSAYTTTGLTMAVHEPSIGRGLLFHRSLAQWIGGAGVIVLALAILPKPAVGPGLALYQAETSGIKLRPRLLDTARAIWHVYAGLTLIVTVYLFAAILLVLPEYGVEAALFDAVNHALTAQSTGGFSTLDDSIAGYGSGTLEIVHLLPMLLGTIALPLYYRALRQRSLRVFLRDPQTRALCVVVVAASALLAAMLSGDTQGSLRQAVFHVVSGASTTGWQTADIGSWPSAAVLLLAGGTMLVGGALGATVGGIKLARAYILSQGVRWRIRRLFSPDDVILPLRIGERSLSSLEAHEEIANAAVFSLLYLAVLAAAVLIVAWLADPSFTLADIVLECVSAQSTVGLSSGLTDPAMPWEIELVFIMQMWVGRLEIFPAVALIGTALAWARRR